MGVFLRDLKLSSYRNYAHLHLRFSGQHAVFYGHNGAGKTNILEAVSLLSPGRGLRASSYNDISSVQGGGASFYVVATLHTPFYEDVVIGTGVELGQTTRKVHINGSRASAEQMAEYCRILWVSPAMDRLFVGPPSDRRRFIDRMVLAIDCAHGTRVLHYEKVLRTRNRLLQEGCRDSSLYSAIEAQLASLATAIAVARYQLVQLLTQLNADLEDEAFFPAMDLCLQGTLEEACKHYCALEVEEKYLESLKKNRQRDAQSGRTVEGPHRSDFVLMHRLKNMSAAFCSTGEQKSLLISLILAHTRLIKEVSGIEPLLLLDEIGAHLDAARRVALFRILDFLGVQALMTGTERRLFTSLEGRSQFFEVREGKVLDRCDS